MKQCHLVNHFWGIRQVLFQVGTIQVTAYSFFILLGLIIGAFIYFREAKKLHQVNEHSFLIAVGAFVGSAIGAKFLELLINLDHLESKADLVQFLFSGRTIIGGLIGGTLGAMLTKRVMGIKAKRGNLFAPAVAMGVAVGRLGCFFNGCCYGKPSSLPWAVDFGDGIARHPTQLYESAFMLSMFFVLKYRFKYKNVPPGYLFTFLMINYFVFRFIIEFIRVERIAFAGLSYFQIISIFVLIYLVLSNKKLILTQPQSHGK